MLTRNLDKARKAFLTRDVELTKTAHSVTAPEEHMQQQGKYIKSVIYGGLDGIITTFAVVAGVAGAALSPAIVLILGFANLIADGISMAVGDYLSTKAEKEYELVTRQEEKLQHQLKEEKNFHALKKEEFDKSKKEFDKTHF